MKQTMLAALAASVCANAWAAESASEAAAADTLTMQRLDEIEVVATRATVSTPIAYTNVTAQELAKANTGVDLPYLLQATPSVITTSDAGTGVGYTSIRVRGTDASRINVTTNGIPFNDAESQNVYWVNLPDMASTLRDVQIQRGAGTSTNGAGAFGASINMQTMHPALDPYAMVDASYGSYNTNRQMLRLGSGLLGDRWAVDARISHIGSDGYIERASSRLWSYLGQVGYYHGGTSVKLIAFGGNERTYHAWDYATREQIEKYGRRYNPCGEYTDTDGKTAYYPDQYDNYTQHHLHLIANHQIADRWHLNIGLHYTKGDGYYEQYKTRQKLKVYGLTPYEYDGETISRSDLVRTKGMDNGFGGGVFSLKYTDGILSAIVGGGLNKYCGDHIGRIIWVRNYVGPLNPQQQYYRNHSDKVDGNVYARANVQVNRHLAAYADIQYRHIDYTIRGIGDNFDDGISALERLDIDNRYNFCNPKAGLDYRFDRSNRLYASVSVAHREPARDNYIDCAPGRPPRPERLYDYELGYQYQGAILSGGANLYYMDYDDQLVPTGQLSDTGNSVCENVPSSYRLGIEAFWTLRPLDWLSWDFTTTLSRNRIRHYTEYIYGDAEPLAIDRRDTPLAYSPSLTLHNSLNLSLGGFDASLQSQYVSRQHLDNSGDMSVTLDPYFVTDLHLGYSLRNLWGIREMRVGVVAYNLFSEKYENNGWAYSYYYTGDDGQRVIGREAGYAVQAPIHFMASLSLKF